MERAPRRVRQLARRADAHRPACSGPRRRSSRRIRLRSRRLRAAAGRLVFETVVGVAAAAAVAVLAGTRFAVEGRASTSCSAPGSRSRRSAASSFEVAPRLGGEPVARAGGVVGAVRRPVAAALVAAARSRAAGSSSGRGRWESRCRASSRRWSTDWAVLAHARRVAAARRAAASAYPLLLTVSLALLALLASTARVGFASATRREGDDLDSWLALAATFDALRRPSLRAHARAVERVPLQGDFLRCWRTARCSSASGARSARPSSGEPWPRSGPGRRGDPRRPCAVPLRALDAREHAASGAHARGGRSRSSSRRPSWPSRRRASRRSRSRRRAARRRSTPRCAATSSS